MYGNSEKGSRRRTDAAEARKLTGRADSRL